MNKIPCIKCTPEIWEYIEPFLVNWRYAKDPDFDMDWEHYPILVIDYCEVFGSYSNVSDIDGYDRELITDINVFLDKAAKLKGFTYINSGVLKNIIIKPGMVIETKDNYTWIVFPTMHGLAVTNHTCNNHWFLLKNFIPDKESEIKVIYDLPDRYSLIGGKLLWEESKEIILTLDEIAEKFNAPVERIRITK